MVPRTYSSGVTLIEVIIGISIVTTMLAAIGFAVTSYVDARATLLASAKSAYLVEEGYEIMRALRDDDWNTIENLALDTTHYLDVTPSTIAVTATPEIIDTDFRRSFIVRAVYRNNTTDDISASAVGATIDDGSRRIEMSVGSSLGTTTVEAILTNLHAL